MVDAPAQPTLCGIPPGQWAISAPIPLEVNDLLIAAIPASGDRSEFDPVLSENGLELYFTSDQSFRFMVWVATRPNLSAPFDTVAQLGSDVNAGANSHFGFQPFASLSRAIISAPYAGSIGGDDYWVGQEVSGLWTWQTTSLSTTDEDGDARLSATGLEVYFARASAFNGRDIYHAIRGDLNQDFGPPELVTDLNSPTSDSGPFLAPSGAGIFVVSDRPGVVGGEDIFYAERSSSGVGFDLPYPLAELNSAGFDGEPTFIELGTTCEMIFVSNRTGAYNLYRSLVRRM